MFPPVPTLMREAERDMDLGGYRVPKGEMLGVAVFSMHNNPAYWQARAGGHASWPAQHYGLAPKPPPLTCAHARET